MMTKRTGLVAMLGVAGAVAAPAWAIEDYVGTPSPVPPVVGPAVPTVRQVIGKEYTDLENITTKAPLSPPGAEDPGQVIAFDGTGGVADSVVDFAPVLEAGSPLDDYAITQSVDALANHDDVLFEALFNGVNAAALLVSHEGDGAAASGGAGTRPLFTESVFGATALWARDTDVNSHDFVGAASGNTVRELDGIEVWGNDGPAADDSDRYSLYADGTTGVSVFAPGGVPLITQATIGAAIGLPTDLIPLVDVDGLMTKDNGDTEFLPGESIIFSIRPILVPDPEEIGGPGGMLTLFDGGEIWQWTAGAGPATFLFHGGHLWDTAFDVMGAFGVGNENIDGIEAIAFVPEPTTLSLAAAAALALVVRRRR